MCCNFTVTGCYGSFSSTLFTHIFIMAACTNFTTPTGWSIVDVWAGSTFSVLSLFIDIKKNFYTTIWVRSTWTVADTVNRTLQS